MQSVKSCNIKICVLTGYRLVWNDQSKPKVHTNPLHWFVIYYRYKSMCWYWLVSIVTIIDWTPWETLIVWEFIFHSLPRRHPLGSSRNLSLARGDKDCVTNTRTLSSLLVAFDEGERFLISWLAKGLRVYWAIGRAVMTSHSRCVQHKLAN